MIKGVILWVIAAIVAIIGAFQMITGDFLVAVVLFVVACLIGPGGYSIFQRS